MLVEPGLYREVLHELKQHIVFGIDCETTGLQFWKHRLFSVAIASPNVVYYFDFNGFKRQNLAEWVDTFEPLFYVRANTWYIANAKFDMHMLENEGVVLNGKVVCLPAIERILKNNLFPPTEYNLDGMAKRYCGEEKDAAVEEYITKHKLFTMSDIPGKKKQERWPHFDKVPLDIMRPYAQKDTKLHLQVGQAQKIAPGLMPLFDNEVALTKVCQKMERVGIKVSVPYTEKALAYEYDKLIQAKQDFEKLTRIPYQDSSKVFVLAFERLGLSYPLTEKGNPCFNADALELCENPVAKVITDIRSHEKNIGTYYSSFLYLRDKDDVLHPNIKQWGCETGRMSCTEPNLQNVPRDGAVRGCFEPRPGFCFVAIDYATQEFRLLLDYAGEERLIPKILAGEDPHTAVAELTGLTRQQAKTLSYALLYGVGLAKLAKMLGVSEAEAANIKTKYFSQLKNVERFMRKVVRVAKTRGYVRNWFGRELHIAKPEWAYVATNHLIQSSGADIIKRAMVICDDYLRGRQSHMLLQVHDELLFEVHETELDIVPHLAKIMDDVYTPRSGMRMETDISHSWTSWSKKELVKGAPCYQKSNEQKTDGLKISLSLTHTR